jgi:hypothetical protein
MLTSMFKLFDAKHAYLAMALQLSVRHPRACDALAKNGGPVWCDLATPRPMAMGDN